MSGLWRADPPSVFDGKFLALNASVPPEVSTGGVSRYTQESRQHKAIRQACCMSGRPSAVTDGSVARRANWMYLSRSRAAWS